MCGLTAMQFSSALAASAARPICRYALPRLKWAMSLVGSSRAIFSNWAMRSAVMDRGGEVMGQRSEMSQESILGGRTGAIGTRVGSPHRLLLRAGVNLVQ